MGEAKYKVIIVGDFAVGKTCILVRLSEGKFSEDANPTIGASFLKYQLTTERGSCELNLWDTSGDERFRSVMPVYFRGANVAIIVYDVTRHDTFENLEYWIDLTKKSGPENVQILVVGAKNDLEKNVTDDEAQALCQKHGVEWITCSALTGNNITATFDIVGKLAHKSEGVDPTEHGKVVIDDPPVGEKKGCC